MNKIIRKAGLIRDQRGQAVIEFALTLPLLLLVLFGITEFGRALLTSNVMHQATREGARVAAVALDPNDTGPILARMNQLLVPAQITPSSVSSAFDPVTRTVTVTITTDFVVLAGGILGTVGFPITATTVMKYES